MKHMKSKKIAIGAAAALFLSACVTATPYQPSSGGISDYGYSETRIEPGKYRVNFRGNSSTDRATVENYILLRAAELSSADGLGHFMVLDEDEGSTSNFNTTGFNSGFGGRFSGRFNNGFGNGFGGTNTSRTRERRVFDIGVIIQGFPGKKSEEDFAAYNAEDVIANIGPIAQRPL